jgi:hypothetical protein
MARKLRHVEITSAKVKSVKADLIGGVVNLTLQVPLNVALPLREDLGMIGSMEMPVEVGITQLQQELDFGTPKPGQILEAVADEINARGDPNVRAEVHHANS